LRFVAHRLQFYIKVIPVVVQTVFPISFLLNGINTGAFSPL